jgi:hypothetical protein
MGCHCKERREALMRTIQAAKRQEVADVRDELTYVVTTMAEDASTLLRQSVAAAKSRLMRLR